jgi:phage baseplate assembly protein W
MWPDLAEGRVAINPPRNGVDRKTGKLLTGWDHCQQSMEVIFITPFHERVLRRWVGSFVPMILGKSLVERIVTRFFWAIASALDLWEPGYKVKQVHFMGNALQTWSPMSQVATADLIRTGQAIFRQEGVWYPRGHLGDYTPYGGRQFDYSALRPE